ncbi:BREX-1 system adenine-specific DNA-methyltransferase PglX [Vibrio cholerae]
MNTNKLKAYAPKARITFMEAVTKRAAFLGLYADRIAEMTIDGDSAVIEGRVFTRQQGQQRAQVVKRIEALGTNNGKFVLKDGFNQFINETAFTWFNRLTAIRYMEVNEYLDHGYRVLSKGEGAQFGEGFEILGSAADVADDLGLNKESIIDMMLDDNKKEEELYRTILLGQCNQLSEVMPFMFEALDDATELLLPDNLTKTDSILKDLVNDIPEDNWQEIEVIGWLYQFYISEHKDAVIGKVVKREDIPAATQLFTPNWNVKYLVQNSLSRQWLATYPDSELKERMEYYITPAEQSDDVIELLKAITPTSIDPEEIKVLDPACGSGHILVEVYEVLREIYLERGYRQREIPELILTKNIYGLDIDDRAAQMAAFAVMMKAREDDKRIFSRDIKLNIHSIQSTENLNINQLWSDLDLDGKQKAGSMGDLFAEPQLDINEVSAENKVYLDLLRYLKEQFIDAKNLGSLIEVDSKNLETLNALQVKLTDKAQGSEPRAREAAQALFTIVEQAIVLATKYDVAVANPPYMGSKGMNAALKDFAKKSFPNSKSDLFAIFMERVFHFLKEDDYKLSTEKRLRKLSNPLMIS